MITLTGYTQLPQLFEALDQFLNLKETRLFVLLAPHRSEIRESVVEWLEEKGDFLPTGNLMGNSAALLAKDLARNLQGLHLWEKGRRNIMDSRKMRDLYQGLSQKSGAEFVWEGIDFQGQLMIMADEADWRGTPLPPYEGAFILWSTQDNLEELLDQSYLIALELGMEEEHLKDTLQAVQALEPQFRPSLGGQILGTNDLKKILQLVMMGEDLDRVLLTTLRKYGGSLG